MNCWKCGSEITPGSAFCGHCGAPQNHPPESSGQSGQSGPNYNPNYHPNYNPNPNPNNGGSGILLAAFATVCAVVYGLFTLRNLLSFVGNSFDALRYGYFSIDFLITVILFNLVCTVLGIWMCFILILIAFKRTPVNTPGLLLCLIGGGTGLLLMRLLQAISIMIFSLLHGRLYIKLDLFHSFFISLFGALITIGGVFGILCLLTGENPFAGKDADDLKADLQQTFSVLSRTASDLGAQAAQAAQNYTQNHTQNYQQPYQQSQPQGPAWNGNGNPGYAPYFLKTDRSLLFYILLCIITCGFYHWYFIYSVARDMNIACAGDGRNTTHFLPWLLLNFITCGIYHWFWMYSLGNRLSYNAPRYGMNFQESGTTILLWMLCGVFLCGIGPFIALYILIKNINLICGAYNRTHQTL